MLWNGLSISIRHTNPQIDSVFFWLLLTASYGLVNANTKFQVHSDSLLLAYRLRQVIGVPQMFYYHLNDNLRALMAKTVDDILVTGKNGVVNQLLKSMDAKREFKGAVHRPEKLRSFGFNINQNQDRTCTINGEDKLLPLKAPISTLLRREAIDDKVDKLEKSTFASINSSLRWLGTTVSPFYSLASSRLQQRLPDVRVSDLIKQKATIQVLKRFGTVISFGRFFDSNEF